MEVSENQSSDIRLEPSVETDSDKKTETVSKTESYKDEEPSQEVSSQAAPSSIGLAPLHGISSQMELLSEPRTSAGAVSSEMESDSPPKKRRVDVMKMSTGAYLDSTVVPILHVALVTLVRIRPEDPVQFVAEFLMKNKTRYAKQIPWTTENEA